MTPNLIPHFILEKQTTEETNGRFSSVCLFADISGFSAVTSTLVEHGSEAAEIMADIMLSTFEPLVDAVYAQGGFITTFAGDAFTALFPFDEDSDENTLQYERALAAAVAIQKTLAANPVQETEHGRFPFSIKIGIADGEVEWGILTPEEPLTVPAVYYFRGSAVDAAARAEHHALPGNIIVTASVADFLVDFTKTAPVADQHERVLTVTDDLPPPSLLALPESPPSQEAFIPEIILQKQDRGGFRQIVTVFINVMGLHHDADLDLFLQSIFTLQTKYGGYLNKVDFGDKGCNLLLFWGTPVSFENDLDRALNFILELSHLSSAIFKAGITLQRTYTGLAGSARRGEFTCYGTGVNMAARLMVAAPWGEIWSDAQVGHHAQTLFTFREEEAQQFKGFVEPQPVYSLVERQEIDLASFYQGEMVGRKAELGQLATFVAPLLNKEQAKRFAGVLVVEGEAGLGKSRLVTEFFLNQQEGATPCQVYLAQTDQTVRAGLNPFRYWLRTYFQQSASHSESRNKRAFGGKLNQLLAVLSDNENADPLLKDLEYGRSFLGALVDLQWDDSPYAALDAAGRHEWSVTALKSLLLAESLRQPVILHLEDVHWLDGESVAFMERLVRQIDGYPLAIIATARPTIGAKPLFGEIAYETIDLTLMGDADLALLAANVLEAPIDDDLAALLRERADGNPFFVEQILRYLQDEGGIELHDGCWQLVDVADKRALPSDVRAIFTARLDRLTQEVKEVVQTAAILGREFEVRVLTRMLQNDESLPVKISAAENEAIWSALSQLRYLFMHGLLRDAAYGMQLRAKRRELHYLAAQTMVELYAQRISGHLGDIATHYEAAYQQGLMLAQQPAIVYLQRAGEYAAANYENSAAINFFSHALTIVPDEAVDLQYQLLLARETVADLAGDRTLQTEDIRQLEALGEAQANPVWQAEASLRQAKLAEEYETAVVAIKTTLKHAQTTRQVAIEAQAHYVWATILYKQGLRDKARESSEMALRLAQAIGDRQVEGNILNILGILSAAESLYVEAQMRWQQSLAISQEVGDQRGVANNFINLGRVAIMERKAYDEAQIYYEQALAIQQKIGDRRGIAINLSNLGLLAAEQGAYGQAQQYQEQALTIRQEIEDRRGIAINLSNLGFLATEQGAYGQAQQYQEHALAIRQKIGDQRGAAMILANMGNGALAQEAYVQAQEYYEQALVIFRTVGDKRGAAKTLAGLADAFIHQGELETGKTHITEAIATRRELGQQPPLMESLTILAGYYLAQEDGQTALTLVNEILAYIDEGGNFSGTEYGLRNWLICYQVLLAQADGRADATLQIAYERLQAKADNIDEADRRTAFLYNVPWHRAIMTAYEKQTASEPAGEVAAIKSAETAVTEIHPFQMAVAEKSVSSIEEENTALVMDAEAIIDSTALEVALPEIETAVVQPPKRSVTGKKKKKKKKKKRIKGKQRPIVINIYIENNTFDNNSVQMDNISLEALQKLLRKL